MTDREDLTKIDREIAEKVMGWKPNPNPDRYRAESINQYGQPVYEVANVGTGCDVHEEVIFRPTTDIAHAFEAVEVVRAKGWWIDITDLRAQWDVMIRKWVADWVVEAMSRPRGPDPPGYFQGVPIRRCEVSPGGPLNGP